MSKIDIQDTKDAETVRDSIAYAAAVVANIRARLDKFGECYVDNADLLKIWAGKPWLEATGNLRQRIKNLAKEMDAKVSWPNKKDEAHFTRNIQLIKVVGVVGNA